MSDTLRNRALVFIVGIPGLITFVLVGGYLFSAFVLIVLLLASNEIQNLSGKTPSIPLKSLLFVSMIVIVSIFHSGEINYVFPFMLLVTLITMFIEIFRKKDNPFENVSTTLFAISWIGFLLGSMILVRNSTPFGIESTFSKFITLAMFISVWACDTFAYIFGKAFGNKKILPRISPNKSWVGSISGVFGSIFVMSLFMYLGILKEIDLIDAVIFGLIFGGFSQLGDFAESLFKRSAGVKDASSLLMGHGGILDRFDSLAIAAPMAYLYIKLFLG
jgi:phosphatidate cytidylyltransferase